MCRCSRQRSMRNSTITGILSPAWEMQATASSGPNNEPTNEGRNAMSPDLYYLLMSIVLCFVQMLIAATGANTQVGLPALAGNREGLPEIMGWPGRARRAHLNMLENLVLFSALVLVAAAAGKANATTAMGAMIFFWARLAYALI